MYQRRKARENALKVLYGLDAVKNDVDEAIARYWRYFDVSPDAQTFTALLIRGTWEHREEIDGLIGSCSENWSIQRMSRVDKSILRMAVFELFYCEDIPPKVSINEAIDLGKIYGSENSGAFINGILDALYVRLGKDHANQDLDDITGPVEP